ncbi:MAG: SPOR domain-containing protein, partial [Caulobacteraceae bacterium]
SPAHATPAHKADVKPVAQAASVPAQKAIAPGASAAAEPSGSVVQIGAFSSDAVAHKEYGDMASAMTGKMTGKTRHIEPLQRDGKTLYRTWVAGFASHADAHAFCEALKAKGKICIVKG